jgi:hypothetical protein
MLIIMAFVKELIDTEEKKEFYDSLKLHDCIGELKIAELKYTSLFIDEEIGAYFYGMGGGSFEIPRMYGIYISNSTIVIQSFSDRIKHIDKICFQKTIDLAPERIRLIVAKALSDMSRINSYDVYLNSSIDQLPTPILMDDFEDKHYGIKCW